MYLENRLYEDYLSGIKAFIAAAMRTSWIGACLPFVAHALIVRMRESSQVHCMYRLI